MGKNIEGVVSRLSGLVRIPCTDNNVIPKMDRRLRMTEVILRFAVVFFALVSAIIIVTASGTRYIFGMRKHVQFTLLKTLLFLVIADGILAVYSLLQTLRCFWSLYKRTILLSKPLAWAIFCCDQVLLGFIYLVPLLSVIQLLVNTIIAYVTFAAAASTAEAAYISEQGLIEFQWISVCMFYRAFCFKCGVGMVNAFLAALCMVVVSGMSAFHLFRLYGRKQTSIR